MAKDSGPKGQQPEALRSLKSAARSGSRKPAGQGIRSARRHGAETGGAGAQAEGRGRGAQGRRREASG